MKSHPQKARRVSGTASPSPPPLSRRRLWLFRFSALLLPLFLLGVAELGLRWAGYGYPTRFFRKIQVGGKDFLANSDTFPLRFFPPALARWPGTFLIPAEKEPDTTRIFIFGESAAMGDPQPAYGASRYMEVLLRERFPGRKFEIVNTSTTAINSHVILPIARECAAHQGDVWIVYMGNNEMVGPFGGATVFGSQAPPLPVVRLNLALQKTRLGQLAMATLRKLGKKSANSSWEGMRMFLRNQIPPEDPRRNAACRNFEANLRDIARAGLGSGARVILNTMSVNLKDCPPFASLVNTNRPAAEREQFDTLYKEALAQQKAGDKLPASQTFEKAARLDGGFAELQYRWGDCLLGASNATARAHFQLACDTDALPFRADSKINGIIRRVAGELAAQGLMLSDAESELAKAGSEDLPGREIFFEHVHFNFHGNYLLGRLWAEQVARLLPTASKGTNSPGWASEETCTRHLGLTPWNRGFVIDMVISRFQRPPLNNQFNNPSRLADLQNELKQIREQQSRSNAAVSAILELQHAIDRSPRDGFLYEAIANLLESLGDRPQAARAYERLHELLPHDFYCNLQLGRLLGELGRRSEGETLLIQASKQRPYIPDVWKELGDLRMAENNYAQALEAYERAVECQPREASNISYLALALARLNRHSDAIATYRRALQIQPELWEAHFGLAGELAAENELGQARSEYLEAIRLNPGHAVSRINLGVVLFRQGAMDDARKQFEAALQIDPTNAAATDYLRQLRERGTHL